MILDRLLFSILHIMMCLVCRDELQLVNIFQQHTCCFAMINYICEDDVMEHVWHLNFTFSGNKNNLLNINGEQPFVIDDMAQVFSSVRLVNMSKELQVLHL